MHSIYCSNCIQLKCNNIWWTKVKNKDGLKKADLVSMAGDLIARNWVERMLSAKRLPRQLLYAQLYTGSRDRDRPNLILKDVVKRHIK